jgi:hypothetical protein
LHGVSRLYPITIMWAAGQRWAGGDEALSVNRATVEVRVPRPESVF